MLQYVSDTLGTAWDSENLAPGDTATGVTSGLLTHAASGVRTRALLVSCESETINFNQDGTPPTAAAGTNLGHALAAGESVVIRGEANCINFSCIDRVSGSTSVVKVTVFR